MPPGCCIVRQIFLDRRPAMTVLNDPSSTDLRQLPGELRLLVEKELEPGERIQWIGQPRARRQLWEWLLLPLTGLPLTAMTAWIVATSEATFNRLFALPFLLGGLALLSAPWWAVRRSRRTVYLVSDRRVLILRAEAELTVHSIAPAGLQWVECRQFRGGFGDLVFCRGEQASRYAGGSDVQSQGFLSIPDVRRVESLVRQLAGTS